MVQVDGEHETLRVLATDEALTGTASRLATTCAAHTPSSGLHCKEAVLALLLLPCGGPRDDSLG